MDFLSLVAYLKMDKSDYEKGLKDSESLAYKTGQGIGTVLNKTAKVAAAGIAATTTAVAGLVTASIKEYKEYEQLVGGVETLFGAQGMSLEEYAQSVGKSVDEITDKFNSLESAESFVMESASTAFKTAGLSANEYMNTVTSFAASLVSSLDGDTRAAASKADLAITDMADNANKMGSSMESIQNAYQGFAKQNYTMLDNLKLGYGGTKEEMARLLEDAEKLSGQKFDLNSYADIVDAIHVVQTEMGITGTTAKEAEHTISGSLGMMKAAWTNLVTGITNPDADISALIDDMVYSAKAALNNLLPAISQALKGVVSLVQDIAPVIAKELPSLIEQVLPMLIQAGTDLFNGLVAALPTIMQVLFDQLPTVIESIINTVVTFLPMIIDLGFTFLEALMKGILDALPQIMGMISNLMKKLSELFSDPSRLENFLNAAVEIIMTIADGLVRALPDMIPAIINVILGIVEMLTEPDRLVMLIQAALQIVLALAVGLVKAIPQILDAMVKIIANLLQAIWDSLPLIVEAGIKLVVTLIAGIMSYYAKVFEIAKGLVGKLIDGIKSMFSDVKKKGGELVDKVKDGFKEKVEQAKSWGSDLIQNFINGILQKWNALKETVSNVAQTVKDFIGFSEPKVGPLSNFHTYAPDMMDLFIEGIENSKNKLDNAMSNAFDFEGLVAAPTLNGSIEYGNSIGNLASTLSQIIQVLPALANQQIVLDTGVLVGQTAPQMNRALGTIYSREQRSV